MGDCATMNLSFTRGDDEKAVLENHRRFAKAVGYPVKNVVLSNQVHETKILRVDEKDCGKGVVRESDIIGIDGLITNDKKVVLMTFFADCVPLFFYDPVKKAIGASHSGWRGSVKRIGEKQKINDTGGDDRDIIALAKAGDEAVVAIFFIRSGKLLGRDHFHMTGIGDSEKQEILTDFIKQFYVGTPFIPKEILTQEDVLDKEILEKWLSDKRGSKVNFAMPKRGSKHQMMELARKNAQNVLIQDSEKLKREEHRTIGAVHELEQLLGIENLNRMEAFDISNTNGYENVASMVVFEKGKAKRSDYRKFKIRTVAGPDDYRCMEEALERRFSHGIREQKEREEKGQDISFGSFTRFPDILMMDGGKGQVNIAVKVLEKMGLNIPVCGMVKDDFHRTRGLYYQNEIIDFPKNSEAFRMVTRLQDEAHRFAITYHKALRGKEQVHSVLDDIKGIGPARRKSLMKYFKDIGKIKEASVEELCKADGITEKTAEEIYRFFHTATSKKNGDVV